MPFEKNVFFFKHRSNGRETARPKSRLKFHFEKLPSLFVIDVIPFLDSCIRIFWGKEEMIFLGKLEQQTYIYTYTVHQTALAALPWPSQVLLACCTRCAHFFGNARGLGNLQRAREGKQKKKKTFTKKDIGVAFSSVVQLASIFLSHPHHHQSLKACWRIAPHQQGLEHLANNQYLCV